MDRGSTRLLPRWQGSMLKGLVLVAGTLAFGGALSLFSIGLLGNGRGIASLDFSWTLFAFSVAAGLAQGSLAAIGCRTAWHWIEARTSRP